MVIKIKNEVIYSLRIDKELMEKLKKLAKEHERSVNSEIIVILKEALKEFNDKK